jgi:hypothetical protein
MQGDRTVTVWRGIAKGDEIRVQGERSRFIFQSARMNGDECLWFSASYKPGIKSRSGVRSFSPDRIQDLSMVLG